MPAIISHQTALVYAMVIAAVADGELKDSELLTINEIVKLLPIFKDFENHKLKTVTGDCVSMLDQPDGIDTVLGLAKEALPGKLRETAYALACEVIATDGDAAQEELEWLSLLRDALHISSLHAAAIEYSVRIRYMNHY